MKNSKGLMALVLSVLFLLFLLGMIFMAAKSEKAGIESSNTVTAEEYLGDYLPGDSVAGSVITTSTLPTRVLERKSGRRYAAITNDGTENVYLYLQNFASASAASSIVKRNKGIRLNANGGSYEIVNDNLMLVDVWVSTTSAKQTITYVEK